MKKFIEVMKKVLYSIVVGVLVSGCSKGTKETVREIVREIPTISDVPNITKETKVNVTGLRSLSENYVIKNVKKANKLLEDTKKDFEKAEKKDMKKATKEFVKDYKEVVDFYRNITKEGKVEAVREELMDYYKETVKFYEDLEIMEQSLGGEQEKYSKMLQTFGEAESREDKLKKQTIEQQLKYTGQQENMIKEFKIHYGKIIPEIEKVQADVDFFVLTLRETAKVYETAYQTAELSMNISNAVDTITELNELGNLTNDIMDSWKNLDIILENLTELSNLVM